MIIRFLMSRKGSGARRHAATVIQAMLKAASAKVPAESALQMVTRW